MIAEAPPTTPALYRPHPMQAEALWTLGLDPYRGVPAGGPVHQALVAGESRSGKSILPRMVACAVADKYPGGRFGIFRRLTNDVIKTQVEPFLSEVGRSRELLGDWNWNRLEYTWRNGSITSFHHMEHEEDVENLGSYEFVGVCPDESCQFTAKQLTGLFGRVTASTERWPDWQPLMLLITVPWGPGFSWHKQAFRCSNAGIAPARAQYGGARFLTEPFGEGDAPIVRSWMPVTTADNPSLNYALTRAGQLAEADPVKREALAHGSWDLNIGGMFADTFRRDIHVVRQFQIPPHWKVRRGYDWGYSAPAACTWVARDVDARFPREFIFREWQQARVPTQEQARLIRTLSYHDSPAWTTLADPSIWRKTKGTGTSEAEELRAAGLWTQRANNNRHQGWARFHDRFAWGQDRSNPPSLYIMDNCPVLINWFETVERSPTDPEDIVEPQNLTDLRDDLPDSARYAIAGAAAAGRKAGAQRHWGMKGD